MSFPSTLIGTFIFIQYRRHAEIRDAGALRLTLGGALTVTVTTAEVMVAPLSVPHRNKCEHGLVDWWKSEVVSVMVIRRKIGARRCTIAPSLAQGLVLIMDIA